MLTLGMKKILVTGGAGYIGSHITEQLIKLNKNVVILDNLKTGYKLLINKKAQFIKGDIQNIKLVRKIIKENEINTIIHLGDIVDRRKFINFKTLQDFRKKFVDRIKDMDVHIIVGNHDTYYKNTNEINAPRELINHFNIYDNPIKINIGGMDMLILPWVNSSNEEDFFIFNPDFIRIFYLYLFF